MINHGIAQQDLKIIFDILHDHKNIYIFGSRVKGTYRQYSDLDICIKERVSDCEIELLNEQFIKSDLPFKIDIVLYDKVDQNFKEIIDSEAINLLELQ